MNIVYFLVPAALSLGLLFLVIFIWCSKNGQYDDLETPAIRILIEEPINLKPQQENINERQS